MIGGIFGRLRPMGGVLTPVFVDKVRQSAAKRTHREDLMRKMKAIVGACALAGCMGAACAAPGGSPHVVTSSSAGLKVAVVATADADWERKLTVKNPTGMLVLSSSNIVPRGQKIVFITLMTGMSRRSDGTGAMECSVKFTRPDGKVEVEKSGVPCLERRRIDPSRIFHSPMAVGFVGEAADPLGVWTFEATATDLSNGGKVMATAKIKLVDAGQHESKAADK